MTRLDDCSPCTMLFIGVSTAQSAAHRYFPAWRDALGLANQIRLIGVDLELGATSEAYRSVVRRIVETDEIAGALITSHKIALYRTCRDLFDDEDAFARLCGEVGCLVKGPARIGAHALDPITAMHAFERLMPPRHLHQYPDAQVLCLGAGGAGVAIGVGLAQLHGAGAFRQFHIVDVVEARVAHALQVLGSCSVPVSPSGNPVDVGRPPSTLRMSVQGTTIGSVHDADAIVRRLPPGSVVINATGMGKDTPGSPLSPSVIFPAGGVVWELNYRGDRPFFGTARAQATDRALIVADGWEYFIVSWISHVACVFGVDVTPDVIASARRRAFDP